MNNENIENAIKRRQNEMIRLERNSMHYHKYRQAVETLLDAIPDSFMLPCEAGYALGVLRKVHQEAEGDE